LEGSICQTAGMIVSRHDAPHLKDIAPELVAELQQLLSQEGAFTLATQVADLPIVDRCRCGDYFCATFYTIARPKGPFGPGHYTIALSPRVGMLNVDVIGSKIVQVEVLYRDDLRVKIHAAVP
jgi:hypothetical protein